MVSLKGLGNAYCKAIEHDVRDRGGGAQTRLNPSPDVARWLGIPMEFGGESHRKTKVEDRRLSTNSTVFLKMFDGN
jgi:hypothetical protein